MCYTNVISTLAVGSRKLRYSLCMSPQKSGPKDWWVPRDWAEEQALRVAKEVRRLRGSRSAQWVSDRTKELGHEVTRSVIADLENGRRRYVTTAELIALALALDTAPIALLYPPAYDEQIEILPDMKTTKLVAAEAFCGRYPYLNAYRQIDVHKGKENLAPLHRAREIARIKDRQRTLVIELEGEFGKLNPAFARAARAELDRISEQLVDMEAGTGDGGRPPLRIGQHGKITRVRLGGDVWLAWCR